MNASLKDLAFFTKISRMKTDPNKINDLLSIFHTERKYQSNIHTTCPKNDKKKLTFFAQATNKTYKMATPRVSMSANVIYHLDLLCDRPDR